MAQVAEALAVAFGRPSIGAGEIDEVVATLRSGWLSTGPRVREFERRFAHYVGARHAVALNSCSAALHLSLLAGEVGPGEEVVTTPLTFCATANAVLHVGGTPVFADIDLATMNLDPGAAAASLTPRTRALLPVHFAGRPAEVVELRALAERHALLFVEDAAHAAEAVSSAGKTGATADFTCFSFYATKNLTTGEGGMVTTSSEAWADRLRVASLHGMSRDAWGRRSRAGSSQYDVVMAGFKYNMTDIQAALGLHQLARLDAMLARRAAIWRAYDQAFGPLPIAVPPIFEPGTVHARHSLHRSRRRAHVRPFTGPVRGRFDGPRDRDRDPLSRLALAPLLRRTLQPAPRHVPQRRFRVGPHPIVATLGGNDRPGGRIA